MGGTYFTMDLKQMQKACKGAYANFKSFGRGFDFLQGRQNIQQTACGGLCCKRSVYTEEGELEGDFINPFQP